jgi:hypothetical protein
MGMVRAIGRGLAAGAAGTTALNAVTYLDMALRARPASPMPAKAVDLMSDKADRPIPGEGEDRDNRREGLGALMGIATGLGVGVAAGIAGPILTLMPRPTPRTGWLSWPLCAACETAPDSRPDG